MKGASSKVKEWKFQNIISPRADFCRRDNDNKCLNCVQVLMSRHQKNPKPRSKNSPDNCLSSFPHAIQYNVVRSSTSCLAASSMQSTTERVSSIEGKAFNYQVSGKQEIGPVHTLGKAGSFAGRNGQGKVGGSRPTCPLSSSSPQPWPNNG